MTTDLKAAAEAAQAAYARYALGEPERGDAEAMAVYEDAATPSAVLALYAERDEALKGIGPDKVRRDTFDLQNRALNLMERRAEAAEASLASYKEEVERLRGALGTIADLHIPDQPAHFGGDELEWAQRHVGTLRRLAIEALTKEPPHAG